MSTLLMHLQILLLSAGMLVAPCCDCSVQEFEGENEIAEAIGSQAGTRRESVQRRVNPRFNRTLNRIPGGAPELLSSAISHRLNDSPMANRNGFGGNLVV